MPTSTSEAMWRVALLMGAAVVALIVSLLLARYIRRRFHAADDQPVFTLQDLRDMRSRGELTEAEYTAMRGAIIGTFRDGDGPSGSAPAERSGGDAEADAERFEKPERGRGDGGSQD